MSMTIKFKNSSLKLRKIGGFRCCILTLSVFPVPTGRRLKFWKNWHKLKNSETKTLQELLRKYLLVVWLVTKKTRHQYFTFHWLISFLLRDAVIEILVTDCNSVSEMNLQPQSRSWRTKKTQPNTPQPKPPKALCINWPSLLVVSGQRLWAWKMNKLLTFFWSSPRGLRQWLGYALPFPI